MTFDSFTHGYIAAMFFTESAASFATKENWDTPDIIKGLEAGTVDGVIPADCDISDLPLDALSKINADCSKFQTENAELLDAARALVPKTDEFKYANEPLTDERLGQLFWYARNGHGVSFTDDGDAECLEKLQDAARPYGQVDLYYDSATDEIQI